MEMSSQGQRPVRAVLLATCAVGALALTWRLRPLAPTGTAAPDVDIVRGCEWLGWVLIGYLEAAVALTAIGHVAGSAGAIGRAVRRLAPRRIRDLVDIAMAVGVTATIIGSAAPPAMAAAPTSTHTAAGSMPTEVSAGLDWPGLHVRLVDPAHRQGDDVVVRPGDTLWTIAARHLPATASAAEVSAGWHAWYAANRDVIGPDPALIHPGQHLTPPNTSIRSHR
jgi:nucleoid-associated protein YgaU